ncbi:hypothetical protein DFJ73DRAFT_760154 [Zopfochytrium polystomum]|nr:hypothetical protein DFJ73DRAFT_760154 [Zopfochytrium polystomum]
MPSNPTHPFSTTTTTTTTTTRASPTLAHRLFAALAYSASDRHIPFSPAQRFAEPPLSVDVAAMSEDARAVRAARRRAASDKFWARMAHGAAFRNVSFKDTDEHRCGGREPPAYESVVGRR